MRLIALVLALISCLGCHHHVAPVNEFDIACGPQVIHGDIIVPDISVGNSVVIPVHDAEAFWEGLIDVTDDYFRVKREQRVRQVGNVLVEGFVETYPQTGATIIEPWRRDAVGWSSRLEGTFQSIRRRARIRVVPTAGGNLVEVRVDKELENLQRPEFANSSRAILERDATLDRVPRDLSGPPRTLGWIAEGRDIALENRIVSDLQARFGLLGR